MKDAAVEVAPDDDLLVVAAAKPDEAVVLTANSPRDPPTPAAPGWLTPAAPEVSVGGPGDT